MVAPRIKLRDEERVRFGNWCQQAARVERQALKQKVARDEDVLDESLLVFAYTLVSQELHDKEGFYFKGKG